MALFKQIFANDPNNPQNVAENGVISIFAPGTRDLVPIKTVTGGPLSNPLQLNSRGFGPAFDAPGFTQVAWEAIAPGEVFQGTFESYEGVLEEAAAAKVEAAAGAAAELAQRVEAGQFKGADGQDGKDGRDGSNVVPTEEAIATAIGTPGTLPNTVLSATTAKSVPFASSLSAKVPVFAPRLAGVPSASVDTLTLLPATAQSQGRLLRPYEPAPRSARYLNVGANPFRVAYANGTRYNFSSPAVPYPAGNEVLPGEEWVETNENRPLWIMSTLGTTVTYEVQIGADLA